MQDPLLKETYLQMPFKSEAQRKLLWAKHPAIARRWQKKYGSKIKKKGNN